ncbi:MAG TPA: carbon-nitrogen hydrolase, partial [Erythrobacter sp.]|nr:carbon-nitrogen hydrolase [Erythrobacter sp.]
MARPPQKKRISRRKGTEKFGQRRLEVRNAMIKDIPGIAHLVRRVYEDMPAYTHGEIRGQINNFREGCFVALLDDEIVGYCA